MDVSVILRSVEQKRPQVILLGASLLFLSVISLLMAGLSEILPVLAVATFGALVGLVPVRVWGSRRMLRPVVSGLAPAESGEAKDRKVVRRALAAVDSYPLRETIWLFSLWMVGLVGVELIVGAWSGTTFWQRVMIAVLALVGAVAEAMLTYHSDLRQLAPVRRALEERLEQSAAAPLRGGNLGGRLLAAYAMLAALVLMVCAVAWYGRARQDAVAHELAEIRNAFHSAANDVQGRLAGGGSPAKALVDVDPDGALGGAWVLFHRDGEVLAGSPNVDPVWLERIARADAEDWLAKRAPFIYMRSTVGRGVSLFWTLEPDAVGAQPASAAGFGLLAGLLMLAMGLILAHSVTRSGLRPLSDLAERVGRLSKGQFEQGLAGGGGGEVALLGHSLDEFAKAVAEVVRAGKRASDGLLDHHRRLKDGLERLHQGGDHRAEIADRTASSVVQMQTSIESISEQVDSLRQASTDCSSTLFEIEQSVREVSTAAENLQSQADNSASAINQITHSMGAVAGNVETLSRRAEETDASISAMGLAIQQVEDHTSETHRLTDTVSEIASRGAESVRETIEGIHDIQSVTGEAREVINRLGQQMEAVGKILTVISDVAQQTNLLALNAAIIAAAAGEHGKGFAVVADEIKDLADRTATSTKEIAGLIKSVQSDSRRAVDAIERGSGSVQRGVQLANNAGNALQQILSAVSEVGRMSSEIHRSTREHSDLAASISKSMGDMSSMLREIRRAMGEQTQGGDRINRVAEQLSEDARFVGRSAGEQVQAVSGASRTMERISEMVGFISKAITEQAQGVGHVAKAAEEVRDASMHEAARLADVEEISDRIGRVTQELKEVTETFWRSNPAGESSE